MNLDVSSEINILIRFIRFFLSEKGLADTGQDIGYYSLGMVGRSSRGTKSTLRIYIYPTPGHLIHRIDVAPSSAHLAPSVWA